MADKERSLLSANAFITWSVLRFGGRRTIDIVSHGSNYLEQRDKIEEFTRLELSTRSTSCIFKIPEIPRRQNEKSYTPIAFSIGLWNLEKNPTLQANDKFKILYMRELNFISTDYPACIRKSIDLLEKLYDNAKMFLESYREFGLPASWDKRLLAFVMILDGSFIIELLLKFNDRNRRSDNDPIFSYMLQFLYHDLLLLENQIPWFVLEIVYDKTFPTTTEKKPLVWHVTTLLKRIFPLMPNVNAPTQEPMHILDLLRLLLVSPIQQQQEEEGWKPIPSATFLRKAGVKIKSKRDAASILQVKFQNGVLEIPPLELREGTQHIFRNLICYEQGLPNCPHVITSYVILMGCLINTIKDYELLHEAGIFDNWMNPQNVTNFFNHDIYFGAYVNKYYYLRLSEQVNAFCKRRWTRLLAIYRNEFTTPWAIISQIVAAILFIFTLLHTVFTISNK